MAAQSVFCRLILVLCIMSPLFLVHVTKSFCMSFMCALLQQIICLTELWNKKLSCCFIFPWLIPLFGFFLTFKRYSFFPSGVLNKEVSVLFYLGFVLESANFRCRLLHRDFYLECLIFGWWFILGCQKLLVLLPDTAISEFFTYIFFWLNIIMFG